MAILKVDFTASFCQLIFKRNKQEVAQSLIKYKTKYIFMTKSFLILAFITLFATSLFAQSPQKINYQAVIKDASGEIVSNQSISIQVNINQDTATGTTVYTETHTITTSQDGLVTLLIGDGTTTDDFSSIAWETASHFLNIAVDVNAGTTYTDIGTLQLVSVPYALVANKTERAEKLESENSNTTLTANDNNVKLNFGLSEAFDFTNSKMRLNAGEANLGNNLQLEFKDDSNINTIENIFPNVTSVSTPENIDYKLNLKVRGNEIISARGDGSVRINNTYTLPNTDGNAGQAIITNGNGELSWSSVVLPNNNYSLPIADGSEGEFIQTDGSGTLSWTTIPYSINNENTVFGEFAGESLSIGSRNVFIGHKAGIDQAVGVYGVMIGYEAGDNNTGTDNTFIGFRAGKRNSTNSGSRNVFIGYEAGVNSTGSDKLFIDNSSTANPLIYGEFNNNLLRVNGNLESTGTLKIGSSSTLNGIYKAAIVRNVGNVNGNDSRVEVFTINGASPGDAVFVSPSENLNSRIVIAQCWVSANNTVSVRFRNTEGGSNRDPDGSDGATYYFSVIK